MLQLLVIGCGGAVGALMRYGLAWIYNIFGVFHRRHCIV